MATEAPIGVQADTLTTAGQIRTITAYVSVGGVLTPVQMQVVVMADATGAPLQEWADILRPIHCILSELREMRMLLCKIADEPVLVGHIPTPPNSIV